MGAIFGVIGVALIIFGLLGIQSRRGLLGLLNYFFGDRPVLVTIEKVINIGSGIVLILIGLYIEFL